MSGLVIRIVPEKKIMISHKGEVLTLSIYKNSKNSEFVLNFVGDKSFIIDQEKRFEEKLAQYKGVAIEDGK